MTTIQRWAAVGTGTISRSVVPDLQSCAGATVVLTVTGHGLKDPQWALRAADGSEVKPTIVPVDTAEIAAVLGLAKAKA